MFRTVRGHILAEFGTVVLFLVVSSGVTLVSLSASDTGMAANDVLRASNGLSEHAERLTTEVDRFVADLRAA